MTQWPPLLSTPPVNVYIITAIALQSLYIREWPLITKRKTAAPTTTLVLKRPGLHKTRVLNYPTNRAWNCRFSQDSRPPPHKLTWTLKGGSVCLWWESISPSGAPITDLFCVHPAALWISKDFQLENLEIPAENCTSTYHILFYGLCDFRCASEERDQKQGRNPEREPSVGKNYI